MSDRTVRPEPGRKYYNHVHYPLMGRYAAGAALRDRLIESGEYIKTSQPPGMGLMQFLRGPLPEYKPFDAAAWWSKKMRDHYGPRHHKGTAIGMNDEHWPGCGHE